MSDFNLIPVTILDNYSEEFDGISLSEITNLALVSIATPAGGGPALTKAIKTGLGTEFPPVGEYTTTSFGNGLLLSMQQRQLLLLFESNQPAPEKIVAAKLNDTGYLSDQSDAYVIVAITGRNAHTALERICPLDLHSDAFPIDKVARTSMEHMSTVILRKELNTFWLMSPRSSAKSFLHAVKTSIQHVT